MNNGNITPSYYALMELVKGTQTPKYVFTKEWGYYPPMGQLATRDGSISMYLTEKRSEKPDAPANYLQAKGSLNFTGLKEYLIDGKLSGYAYGNPLNKQTFGKDKKVNPFYNYKDSGFLFIMHHDTGEVVPNKIELLVLEHVGNLIGQYIRPLKEGGFDDFLTMAREEAKIHFQ